MLRPEGTKQGRLPKWQECPHLCTQLAFITEHEEAEFLELESNKKCYLLLLHWVEEKLDYRLDLIKSRMM